MLLKPLSAEESNEWMNTINSLADWYNSVQKYVREAANHRERQYTENYPVSGWKSFFLSLPNDYGHLFVYPDGTHNTFSWLCDSYLKKIDDYTPIDMKARKLVHNWISSGRKEKICRTMDMWCVYANIPFQIDASDLEMYQNVKKWKEEVETIAKELGIDETYHMDEDSV